MRIINDRLDTTPQRFQVGDRVVYGDVGAPAVVVAASERRYLLLIDYWRGRDYVYKACRRYRPRERFHV